MYREGVVAVGGVVDSGGVMPFVITLVIRGASFVIPETSTGLFVPVVIFFVIPFVSFVVTPLVIRGILFVLAGDSFVIPQSSSRIVESRSVEIVGISGFDVKSGEV